MVEQAGETRGAKYVYGVVRAERARDYGAIGIGGSRVYSVPFGAVAAVVSDASLDRYDATREHVLAHEFVNESVMRDDTVIPMAFGTVFRAEEDVLELLRSTHDVLDDALEQMRDKVEIGLKVLWNRERVATALEGELDEVRELGEQIARNDGTSTYFLRTRLRGLVDRALEERGRRYVGEVHEALRPFAVASRSNEVVGDRVILNSAFLLRRDGVEHFDTLIDELGRRYDDVLTFRVTGPWPPYNFVNIKLRLERAGGAS